MHRHRFFLASKEIDVKQLVGQTIFLAVLLAVTVNPAAPKVKTNNVYEVRPAQRINAALI